MSFLEEDKIRYILLFIIIVLELIVIGVLMLDNDTKECISNNEVVPIIEEKKVDIVEEIVSKIKVDIKGAVKKAGVYELDEGSRISDLIKLAGGLKSNASTKYLNLSKRLEDEMVIKVYTENQIKNMNITYNVQEECKSPSEDITSCAGASITSKGDSTNDNTFSKISINKASKEELMTLSGIGESKADAIIEYRNTNNGFKSLEELMNVSGIGEAAYNKIKDNITL